MRPHYHLHILQDPFSPGPSCHADVHDRKIVLGTAEDICEAKSLTNEWGKKEVFLRSTEDNVKDSFKQTIAESPIPIIEETYESDINNISEVM